MKYDPAVNTNDVNDIKNRTCCRIDRLL